MKKVKYRFDYKYSVCMANKKFVSKIKLEPIPNVAPVHSIFNTDIVGIISKFLSCKDAVKICYLNKQFYSIFLLPVIRNGFVFINTNHIVCEKNINGLLSYNTSYLDSINLYIDGIKQIKEPIFLHIEKTVIAKQVQYTRAIENEYSTRAISHINTDMCSTVSAAPWGNLRYVMFGRSFNLSINNLPSNVEEIYFHPKGLFNQKITMLNCQNLRKIFFGKFFNQRIDCLPGNVKIIQFCDTSKFNRPIKKCPIKLQEIYFGQWFNQRSDALMELPDIKKIQFAARSKYLYPLSVPDTCTSLEIIGFGTYYDADLDIGHSSVKVLKFYKLSRFNRELELPMSLEHLIVGEYFNKKLLIPGGLLSIKFYAKSRFNHLLELPNKCRELSLGRNFNSELRSANYFLKIQIPKRSKFQKNQKILN